MESVGITLKVIINKNWNLKRFAEYASTATRKFI